MPFSSMIAQGSYGELNKYKIYNKNIFRKEKIIDDIEGALHSVLENCASECDFFFIDFLEERFDVAELDDGNYVTLSEALKDSQIEGLNIKHIIRANTLEHFEIWRTQCEKLVKLIKNKFDNKQIVLIKSRLATYYMDDNKLIEYPERDLLEKTNHMIEKKENYFLNLIGKKIQIYSYPEMIYSDKKFRMGAQPQYLSSLFYWAMSIEISTSLDYIC